MTAPEFTFTTADFEEAVGSHLDTWAAQCHAASVALVRTGVLGSSRVARGTCTGVGGQHSWVVVGNDCYDPEALIVDPTLWSYDDAVEGVWVGHAPDRPHEPFGAGSIWEWGRPRSPEDEVIELDGDFSPEAEAFLELVGPLDFTGWVQLAHAPVGGWPSKEILTAMYRHPGISPRIPIDIIGMATDLNPGGLYLREEVTWAS